ncbi:MAG: HipA N-terminal domain-containing protein [Acidobacteria bacterium]|nr:HipA N-terminal domain-containing protein [Acidobacteriota bacterium]
MRSGIVRLDGVRVGYIEETENGTRFTYDDAWLRKPDAVPVSLTLPLRKDPYESRGVHPFFENLLPEGWLLELSTSKLKISKDDVFGLLLATCADCVGAVEIVKSEEDGSSQ